MGGTDRCLAPVARIERPNRSDQQLGQASEAHSVRVPTLRALPNPRPALRRQTQLVTPRPTHPTVKSEEPLMKQKLSRNPLVFVIVLLSFAWNVFLLIGVVLNLGFVHTRAAGGQFTDFPTGIRVVSGR